MAGNYDDPKVGEVWREVDPRFERFVMILNVVGSAALIQTCVKSSMGQWRPKPRSRSGWAALDRFNGKRTGYEPTEQVPA